MNAKRPTPKKKGKAKKKIELTPANVLKVLRELGYDRRGQLVTTEMVANKFEVKVEKLAPILRRLKKRGVIYRRRRGTKVVWFPARGQYVRLPEARAYNDRQSAKQAMGAAA